MHCRKTGLSGKYSNELKAIVNRYFYTFPNREINLMKLLFNNSTRQFLKTTVTAISIITINNGFSKTCILRRYDILICKHTYYNDVIRLLLFL